LKFRATEVTAKVDRLVDEITAKRETTLEQMLLAWRKRCVELRDVISVTISTAVPDNNAVMSYCEFYYFHNLRHARSRRVLDARHALYALSRQAAVARAVWNGALKGNYRFCGSP
jgi:hypothetical protein